ncbi:MAG TPA: porin family protein [Flavisolibacter sp.]|nr:porin family protein [Flavisolibacter sp.]
MRKYFLVLLTVLSGYLVTAQIQVGVHADVILASQKIEVSGFDLSGDNRVSWRGGLVANIPATEQISFMPQLNLLSKGGKFDIEDVKTEFKLTYLELPLNFVYNSSGFFAGLGPVLSYGMGGKVTATDGTDTEEIDVKFDGKKEADVTDEKLHLKGFEFSGNVLAGYKLPSGLFFKATYNFGLSNISPEDEEEGTMKNSYYGFGIGYFFGSNSGSAKK